MCKLYWWHVIQQTVNINIIYIKHGQGLQHFHMLKCSMYMQGIFIHKNIYGYVFLLHSGSPSQSPRGEASVSPRFVFAAHSVPDTPTFSGFDCTFHVESTQEVRQV